MRKSRDTLTKRSNQPSIQQQPPPKSYMHKLGTRVKSIASKSLRLGGTAVGIVAVAQIGLHYYQLKQVEDFFGILSKLFRNSTGRQRTCVPIIHELFHGRSVSPNSPSAIGS